MSQLSKFISLFTIAMTLATSTYAGEILRIGSNIPDFGRATSAILELVKKQPHAVLYWGEKHNNPEAKALLLQVATQLRRNAGYDCLLVEIGPEYQYTFDLLSMDSSQAARTEYLRVFSQQQSALRQAYGFAPIAWLDADYYSRFTQQGLRLWAADMAALENLEERGRVVRKSQERQQTPQDRLNFDRVMVVGRNQIMADRLQKLTRNGACTKSLFPVGAAHVFDEFVDPSVAQQNVAALAKLPAIRLMVEECDMSPGGCDTIPEQADLTIYIRTNRP